MMQIVLWVLSTAFLVIKPWYISWIGTFVVLFFVAFSRVAKSSLSEILHLRKTVDKAEPPEAHVVATDGPS